MSFTSGPLIRKRCKTKSSVPLLIETCADEIARVSRHGQNKTPKAYIIADPDFVGDKMAIKYKNVRAAEDVVLRKKVPRRALEGWVFDMVDKLMLSPDEYAAVRTREYRQAIAERGRGVRLLGGTSQNPVEID
jgi:hypothetical protein